MRNFNITLSTSNSSISHTPTILQSASYTQTTSRILKAQNRSLLRNGDLNGGGRVQLERSGVAVADSGCTRAGERRRGRDIMIALDHGPNSKHAFDWAITHLCRLADTLHLVFAISSLNNKIVYDMTQGLMEKLAAEAFEVAMVKTKARIVEGDAGKVICKEAERLKPAAVVMGTRGRSLIQSVIQGSISEYCFHNCKTAPIIVVPGKDAGEKSVL